MYSLQKKDRGILASGKAKTAAIPEGYREDFQRRQAAKDPGLL
jgi:hypothetical protein